MLQKIYWVKFWQFAGNLLEHFSKHGLKSLSINYLKLGFNTLTYSLWHVLLSYTPMTFKLNSHLATLPYDKICFSSSPTNPSLNATSPNRRQSTIHTQKKTQTQSKFMFLFCLLPSHSHYQPITFCSIYNNTLNFTKYFILRYDYDESLRFDLHLRSTQSIENKNKTYKLHSHTIHQLKKFLTENSKSSPCRDKRD